MTYSLMRRAVVLGAAALAAFTTNTFAKDFPERPIKLIVPYTPGGVADVFARKLGEIMAADLGQPVVIENKPGANTMVGAAAVANAPADGYTLFQTTSALMFSPLLYKKMAYDAKVLQPIAVAFEAPLVFIINPKNPAKNLQEFAAYARGNSGKSNYASVGPGNLLHFVPEMFKAEAKFDMTHISYNGKSAEALGSILSGDVDLMATVAMQAVPAIKAGKLRPLAVTSSERLAPLPDVPTVAESGFPRLKGATWYGLAAHTATPEPVVARVVQAFNKALTDPAFRKYFSDLGMIMLQPRNAAEVAAYAREEVQRWGPLIREQNISLD